MTRVAVTTDRFDEVSSAFERVDLEPIALPCIKVVPAAPAALEAARQECLTADVLLVTSERTVDLLWPEVMPPVPVAAVGSRTAQAVAARGGRVVIEGGGGVEALVDRLPLDARALYPHAGGAHLLDTLVERIPHLRPIEIYRAVPIAPGPDPVGVVTFASASAVAGWLLSRDLAEVVIGVIGETTACAVAAHRPPNVIAAHPSFSSLAESVATYLEAGP